MSGLVLTLYFLSIALEPRSLPRWRYNTCFDTIISHHPMQTISWSPLHTLSLFLWRSSTFRQVFGANFYENGRPPVPASTVEPETLSKFLGCTPALCLLWMTLCDQTCLYDTSKVFQGPWTWRWAFDPNRDWLNLQQQISHFLSNSFPSIFSNLFSSTYRIYFLPANPTSWLLHALNMH